MNAFLVLLVLAVTIHGITSWVLEKDPESDYYNVKNFSWITDSSALRWFSHMKQLHFINAQIDTVSQNFLNQLEECVWLKFTDGNVKTVYITSKLSMISMKNTSTEALVIEAGQEYTLGTLVINRSKLTGIPQNINQLKKITRIDIIENWIESVSLNEFSGLNKLYEINLSGNGIRHLNSNGLIKLPNLYRLKLQNNQLHRLDTCSWSMPKLFELLLHNNHLTHFKVSHLSSLGHLTLASNPLNCEWMNSLVSAQSFHEMDEYTCDSSNKDDVELHCPSTRKESKQPDVNENSELNSRFQKIESALQNLQTKLTAQRNTVNDIVESIYRQDIEKAFGSKNDL